MFRYAFPLIIFIGLAVFLALGPKNDPKKVPSPFIDKPAPGFSAPSLLDPDKYVSLSDLKGKVTLLNVWASWCAACYEEHPVLNQLAEMSQTPIYGLNYKDAREAGIAWLDKLGNPYHDTIFDVDGKIGIDYGVYGVPETFVIDRAGIIRYKHIGPITQLDLESKILPLIKQLENEQPG